MAAGSRWLSFDVTRLAPGIFLRMRADHHHFVLAQSSYIFLLLCRFSCIFALLQLGNYVPPEGGAEYCKRSPENKQEQQNEDYGHRQIIRRPPPFSHLHIPPQAAHLSLLVCFFHYWLRLLRLLRLLLLDFFQISWWVLLCSCFFFILGFYNNRFPIVGAGVHKSHEGDVLGVGLQVNLLPLLLKIS